MISLVNNYFAEGGIKKAKTIISSRKKRKKKVEMVILLLSRYMFSVQKMWIFQTHKPNS